MSCICSNPNTLVIIAASVAAIIAESQSLDDINILSGFFTSIGDNLALIAAQEEKSSKEEDLITKIE